MIGYILSVVSLKEVLKLKPFRVNRRGALKMIGLLLISIWLLFLLALLSKLIQLHLYCSIPFLSLFYFYNFLPNWLSVLPIPLHGWKWEWESYLTVFLWIWIFELDCVKYLKWIYMIWLSLIVFLYYNFSIDVHMQECIIHILAWVLNWDVFLN